MVLIRALCALVAVTALAGAAGCGQSLFDAHGRRDGGTGGDDDGGGGGDGSVPEQCPADACIADAGADFNNLPGGANGHWSYFEDKRNRMWGTMVPGTDGAMRGAEAGNRIEPCGDSSAAGCKALPGALLISSSGMTADPAIAYRQFLPHVIQLALRVNIDSGDQRVWLYRNSREDVLFSAIGTPANPVQTTVTVDALANDRFYVALQPMGGPGSAALRFFVIDAKQSFPQTCQLAVPFTSRGITANSVRDLCGNTDVQSRYGDLSGMPGVREDPFGNASDAAYFEPDFNYRGAKPLAVDADFTVQFWAVQDNPPSYPTAWLYSDIDEDTGGGIGVHLRFTNPIKLEAAFRTTAVPATYSFQGVDYPGDHAWHFVRLIRSGGMVTLCLDGTQKMSFSAPAPRATLQPPSFGRNGRWDSSTYLLGGMDDVRVFSGTLPCN